MSDRPPHCPRVFVDPDLPGAEIERQFREALNAGKIPVFTGKAMARLRSLPVMDPGEFREAGYLQEANRQFFHPLGLALAVAYSVETGTPEGYVVYDVRRIPRGAVFGCTVDEGKANRVEAEREAKAAVREECYGWTVQPVDVAVAPEDDEDEREMG